MATARKIPARKVCTECRVPLRPTAKSNARFCSGRCRQSAYRRRHGTRGHVRTRAREYPSKQLVRQVPIRFDRELYAILRRDARQRGLTVAEVVRVELRHAYGVRAARG